MGSSLAAGRNSFLLKSHMFEYFWNRSIRLIYAHYHAYDTTFDGLRTNHLQAARCYKRAVFVDFHVNFARTTSPAEEQQMGCQNI